MKSNFISVNNNYNLNNVKKCNFNNMKFSNNNEISLSKTKIDKITISDEALEARKKIDEEKKNAEEEAKIIEQERARIKENMEMAKEQAEAHAEMLKTLIKCLKIASNIIDDKKVPIKDENFLMASDNEMYVKAILLRNNTRLLKKRDEEDREECKSVLDEENSKFIESNSEFFESSNYNVSESSNYEISDVDTSI